jgi:predicted RNA-binding Zn ribbon-like protein
MTPSAPAFFIADSPGLDFLNSIATPVDVPVEWITDGAGLLAWLEQSRLVPAQVLEEVRQLAMPGELDAVAAQARALREWFRCFVAARKGAPLKAADVTELEQLNRLLTRDQGFLRMAPRQVETDGAGHALEIRRERRWPAPESLLQPIAEALARLVCEEDFSYVRACEGPTCTLLFVDHTKGHRRRWCSMAACGNRAKQLAHYQRRKARG